jgi:predicted nucleic acid-binding protein
MIDTSAYEVFLTNDVWIAASAMQYGLKVLTTDRHYIEIPQIITEYHPI